MEHVAGRSINLAMSVRGLSALNQIGIGKHVAEEYGIPMYSRLIHTPSGETYAVPYGKKDECIYSVGTLASNFSRIFDLHWSILILIEIAKLRKCL